MQQNKKAQAIGIQSSIIGIALVAIVLSVGAAMLDNIQTGQGSSGIVVNESDSIGAINTSFSLGSIPVRADSQVIIALNHSAGAVVTNTTLAMSEGADGAGNYTMVDVNGTVRVHSIGFTGSAFLSNYTNTQFTTAFNASDSGKRALETFSNNLGTLALVIVFGVILAFLGRFLINKEA